MVTALLAACLLYPVGAGAAKPTKDSMRFSANHQRTLPLATDNTIKNFAYEGYINGLLLQGLGEPYAAIDNLKKAQQIEPQSFEISYALAELYYNLRDPGMALKELARTGKRNRDYYRLAVSCYQTQGDMEKAVEAAVNLVRIAPDEQLAYSFLANAYRQRQDVDSTLWAYENIARLSPNNFRVWNELGQLRMRTKSLDAAKEAFQNSLRLDRTEANIMAFAALSDLHGLSNQPESAKVLLKEALQVDTNNILLRKQLIMTYVDQDSFALALPLAIRSVELSPLDRNLVRRLGMIYTNLDSLDKADSIFTQLVNEGEDLAVNYFFLGSIAYRRKDYAGARDQYRKLVILEDTVVDRWASLAVTYRMLGQDDSELAVYREGLNHVPSDSSKLILYFGIASHFDRVGQLDSAVSVLEELVSKYPKNASVLNYLGYLLADKNLRLEYARDLIKRALDIDPDNGAFLDSYGWVYYRLQDFDKAVKYLRQAAETTKDAVIFEHLGDALLAQGKQAEAREWWRKALELDPQKSGLAEKLKQ